jgi:glyoxylase-like metal-dependent hydrolase (beta-lactamase superfamily II)
LLTHGHFDHVGAVGRLAEKWDVPVYAHPLEMPYLTGRSAYPPPDPSVGGGAMSLLSPVYPRGPVDLRPQVLPLPPDGRVPGLHEWRWIHTPGHTAGHVSLFRAADRVLIAGDAIATTRQESALAVMTQRPELHGPPAYYTSDWAAARRSVETLAKLRPMVAATGHGLPLGGPALADALEDLADRFDLFEKPRHGRYVRQPAVTDEEGIVALPPPVAGSAVPALLAGLLAAGVIWRLASRERRQR